MYQIKSKSFEIGMGATSVWGVMVRVYYNNNQPYQYLNFFRGDYLDIQRL